MNLRTQNFRDLRRYLRTASDNIEDVADLLGVVDKDQQRRLRSIGKRIEAEIEALDQKTSKSESSTER